MRSKIVEQLCRTASAELAAKATALVEQHGNLAVQLVAAGFAPPAVLDACCAATGLPPAPLQWLRDPRPPATDGLDPSLCKKLGAAPIASTAGRLCIAYADPEVAAAADTLGMPPHVAYLALPAQLEKALSLLGSERDEAASTRAISTAAMLDEELPTTAMPGISPSSLGLPSRPGEPEAIDEAEPMEAADFEELPEEAVADPPANPAPDLSADQEAMTIAADVAALRAAALALDDPTGASSVEAVEQMDAIASAPAAPSASGPDTPFDVPTDVGPLARVEPEASFDVPTSPNHVASKATPARSAPSRDDDFEDRTASVDAFSAMEGIDLAALDREAARRKEAEKREAARKAAEKKAEEEALAIAVVTEERDDHGVAVAVNAPPVPREAAPLVLNVFGSGPPPALATDATLVRAGVAPQPAPPSAPPTPAPPSAPPQPAGINLDEASSFLESESAVRPSAAVRSAPESSLPRVRPIKDVAPRAPAPPPAVEHSGSSSRRFEVARPPESSLPTPRPESSLPTSRPPTSAAEVSGAKPRAMVSLDPEVRPLKEATGKMPAAKGETSGKSTAARGNEGSQRNGAARGPGESGKSAAARGETSGKTAAARGESAANVVAIGPPAEGGGAGRMAMAAAGIVIVGVVGVMVWKGASTMVAPPPPKTRPVIPGSMDGQQDATSRQLELVARGRAEKDHNAAIAKFSEAITLNPFAPGARDAYYERARRHVELKAWRQAEFDLKELGRRPDTAELKDAIEKLQREVARERAKR